MDDRTLATGDQPMIGFGRLSIRSLMFLLVLVVLLPATAVSAWFLNTQLAQARAAAEAEVKLLANSAAAVLHLTLIDQQAVMTRLSERPQVRALDAENFDPAVAEYLRVHPEFNNLGVRDRNGRLVFSGRPGAANTPEQFREFPWFKEGIASGRFMASDAFKGTLSGRWVTVLTQPVRDSRGEVVGLMNLSQDLLALNQRVLGSVPADAVVAVADRQGRYLLRSAEPEEWLGKPGPARAIQDTQGQKEGFLSATGPDAVVRLYAFVTQADTGWRVIAGVPQDRALAGYRALLRNSLLVGLGILLLAALAAWAVGRRIVSPVDALSSAAARIADGDNLARAPAQGPAEIRAVAQEFNRMVEARVRDEQALRTSENSLAITLESIGDAVIATDLQGRVTRMNATAEHLTGWPLTDAAGRPLAEVFRIVNAETRAPALDPVQRVLETGAVVGLANHTALLARDGAEYQIADSAAPIRDHEGSTVGVVLVFSDVTERYRVEQAMRTSTEVLRLRDRALAEISQGVMITDARGRITYVNPGFERLTGYSESTALGRTASFLQGQATSALTVATISSAVHAGTGFHGEILNYRKDGVELWVALDISPLHDEKGALTGFVGAQRDITERKQAEAARRGLESQLRESQKMEAIGTLAGGIAHDFNNILAAILGNLALARDEVGTRHAAQQSLEQITRASLRARALVQQILTFSRRHPQQLVVQPLNPILQETLALLRSTLPAMVDVHLEIPAVSIYVSTDATQMQQVLMNLCTNAWHALAGSTGRIEVGLDERPLDAATGRTLGELPAGRYAHLWVCDTGVGMDEPTRARMFEPFFTTKPVGDGTGLGLSVVHGIVSAQGGGVRVTSEVGKGTTVDLYFPIREPTAADTVADSAPVREPEHGHGEHVLYVDDDEVVRLVVERLLQRAGLHVVSVGTASAALEALAATPTAFDLVVTDFNMPGSSGLDLARAVMRLCPGLPVVITSGYLSDELSHGAAELGIRHLLQKQNLFEELVPTALRILSERGAATLG
jgi:PAS domain S-box-containing protein